MHPIRIASFNTDESRQQILSFDGQHLTSLQLIIGSPYGHLRNIVPVPYGYDSAIIIRIDKTIKNFILCFFQLNKMIFDCIYID